MLCVTLNGGPRRISCRSKEQLSPTLLLTEQLLHLKKYYFQCVRTLARVIIFISLLFYGRHVGAPRKGTNMAFKFHTKLYKFR